MRRFLGVPSFARRAELAERIRRLDLDLRETNEALGMLMRQRAPHARAHKRKKAIVAKLRALRAELRALQREEGG